METDKPNDTSYRDEQITGRIREGHGGQTSGAGGAGKYSYRLVHTQESIRVLDLRLDLPFLARVEDIGIVLDELGRSILARAILGELDEIAKIQEAEIDRLK